MSWDRWSRVVAVGIVLFAASGAAAPVQAARGDEPDRVVVQHILVSFKGKSSKPVERSKKEARALAAKLLERAKAGEDFDGLVREYTDDSYPGIYTMSNRGLGKPPDGVNREDMVFGFGDLSFGLGVGEIGMCDYSVRLSPFGWHIIKRLE